MWNMLTVACIRVINIQYSHMFTAFLFLSEKYVNEVSRLLNSKKYEWILDALWLMWYFTVSLVLIGMSYLCMI